MPAATIGTAPVHGRGARPVDRPTSVTGVTLARAVDATRRAVRHDERPWIPTRTSPRDGHEPDVRLSFANERTFLAWERTALGLITAGLAITQLLPSFDFPGGRRLIGLPLIALGIVIAAVSYWEWRRNQEAMRHDRPLPRSWLPLVVADRRGGGRGHRLRAGDRRGLGIVTAPRRAAGSSPTPSSPTSAPTWPGTAAGSPSIALRARRHARAHAARTSHARMSPSAR